MTDQEREYYLSTRENKLKYGHVPVARCSMLRSAQECNKCFFKHRAKYKGIWAEYSCTTYAPLMYDDLEREERRLKLGII